MKNLILLFLSAFLPDAAFAGTDLRVPIGTKINLAMRFQPVTSEIGMVITRFEYYGAFFREKSQVPITNRLALAEGRICAVKADDRSNPFGQETLRHQLKVESYTADGQGVIVSSEKYRFAIYCWATVAQRQQKEKLDVLRVNFESAFGRENIEYPSSAKQNGDKQSEKQSRQARGEATDALTTIESS
jgi:hypothetical protein